MGNVHSNLQRHNFRDYMSERRERIQRKKKPRKVPATPLSLYMSRKDVSHDSHFLILEKENWTERRRALLNKQFVNDITSRFHVVRKLGAGTTGDVYQVISKEDARNYALKQFRRDESASQFWWEYNILSRLGGKGIVRMRTFYADHDSFYLVTELGEMDLFSRAVGSEEHVRESEAKMIIGRLLQTLASMHRQNIVHRDIKPENVIFSSDEPNQPKLIDFGDALFVRNNSVYKELVGTPCYLSPERWRRHYGWELKASDVWAVGVLTYEILTGKRCFYAEGLRALKARIQRGKWKLPSGHGCSHLCEHFLSQVLTLDSRMRLTAEQCLNHPWILSGNLDQFVMTP